MASAVVTSSPAVIRCSPSFSNDKLPSLPSLLRRPHPRPRPPLWTSPSRRFRPTASASVAANEDIGTRNGTSPSFEIFSCPICYEPLIRKGPSGLNIPDIYRSGFKCQKCQRTFSSKDVYLDLTVTSGTTVYSESKPTRTELFRIPLVSFLYERGWRQNFRQSGFPGPDEEFKMAQEYFKPASGGLLLDVSCGSGLFSRKFASSGAYASVIALDFSENMLRQCYNFIQESNTLLRNLALLRADISRLPFASGSIDAVHAGAALHCWPSPSNALAEINRILRSGGVFVATTFLSTPLNSPFQNGPLKQFGQVSGLVNNSFRYLTEKEIEDLCKSCGFINYSRKVERAFIMFSVQKP